MTMVEPENAVTDLEPDDKESGILRVVRKAFENLAEEKREIEPRGIFKPLVQSITNIAASGDQTVDFGMPVKGRMWMVREVGIWERDHEFASVSPETATSTGAAGAAVSVSLPFFSPYMTGFDVEIQPATTAGVATITVSGAGFPTLTYYLEESTTNTVSKNIRFPSPGIPQGTVSVSAVASGGIVTVNVFGDAAGSPANVGWYVGQPDSSTGVTSQKPSQVQLRWTQGQDAAGQGNFMPFFTTFAHRAFPVTSPDHLVAYVNSAIAGEHFVLIAIVEEFRIRDIESMKA